MNIRIVSAAAAILALSILPVSAHDMHGAVEASPPGAPFKAVSSLVKLPDFVPGLGQLFVDPTTVPAGPFLAYDHKGKLVSTIYMLPIKDFKPDMDFGSLAAPGGKVDHITVSYNAGHPGVEEPHIHVILWHVPAAEEVSVAK
jgi:hypothetical protein